MIYSESEDEHMGHLTVVLKVLKEYQLFAKYTKCKFRLRSIDFLGHIVSSKGIDVYPKRTEVVMNRPRSLTPTDDRSFLGFARYYRIFVDGFAPIASLFKTLTQKKANFEWMEACERVSKC